MIDIDTHRRPQHRRLLHPWEIAVVAAVLLTIVGFWIAGTVGGGHHPVYARPDAVSQCIDSQEGPAWYGNDTPDEFAAQLDSCLVVGGVDYTATSRYASCINRVTNAEEATVAAEEDALAHCWPAWPLPAWLNQDLTG